MWNVNVWEDWHEVQTTFFNFMAIKKKHKMALETLEQGLREEISSKK